jgi:hypothetical protein
MSLDRSLEGYHEFYAERYGTEYASVIDEAYDAVEQVFKNHGWPTSNTDRAEDLVSAIVKYAVLSKADKGIAEIKARAQNELHNL